MEPECEHTNTKVVDAKEATCAEDGHTGKTVCDDCGETIDEGEVIPATGEHNYENGSCTECGATDPNYQPEEPADGKTLIAYITTAEGGAWVAIDKDTLALTALTDYSDVAYDGAGLGADGMIYASVNGSYVQIDVANDFTATTGGATAYGIKITDGTSSAPAQDLVLVDTKSGEEKTATVGGYMYYGADDFGSPYTVKLLDFTANSYKVHSNFKYDDAIPEAMAFLSAEQADASYFNEYYLVLAGNGDLYKHTEQSRYYSGTFGYQRSAEMIADLNLTVLSGGASMTMLEENLALISLNTASAVELYTYDLNTATLTKLGTLEGATDLVGLSLVEGIEVPEQPAEEELKPFAYVTTADGSAWVSIDVETLALTALSDYSDVVYDGAGMGHDGMLYASADGKYVQIDTAKDFAATTGGDLVYSMTIHDGTASAAEETVTLIDEKSLAPVEVTVGGYMQYVAMDDWNTPYLVKLFDFEEPKYEAKYYYNFDDVGMEAIAYISSELLEDGTYFYEHFLVLNENGDLFKHTEKTKVYDNTRGWRRSSEMVADLNLDVTYGTSMTMLTETLALISVNGEDSVVLYTYDLETEELTELGTLEGVTALVGLTMPAAEEEEEAAAANKVTGSTMTLVATSSDNAPEAENEDITVADDVVTINLRDSGTNGKLIITFDPAAMTYKSMSSASVYYSINEARAAEGQLILAYAAAEAISAEDILATLTFEAVKSGSHTVTVEHKEAGDAASDVKEELTVEIPSKEPVYTAKWKTISTTLTGNIGLNFYAEMSADLVNHPDTYVRFTFCGRTIDVPMADAVASGANQYRFTCPITAKNMTDDVTAQVMLGDTPIGTAKTMDVATYCNWVIDNYTDAKTVNLMKAMLNYGASAQLLFEHNTDDLANAALSEADKALPAVDASAFAHSVTGTEAGIKASQMTLLLDSETSIRIYFQLTGSKTIDAYTFYVDGKEVQPVAKDGMYYVQIPHIPAHRLGQMYEVTVGGITVTYGALSYINQVLTTPNVPEVVSNMAKALFLYHEAAMAYKG